MPVKFAGIPFTSGGKTIIVPPLNLAQVQQFSENVFGHDTVVVDPTDNKTKPKPAAEILKGRLPVALAAVQRNYPDMTMEQFSEFVTLRSWPQVWAAAIGQSELPESTGEEAPAATLP